MLKIKDNVSIKDLEYFGFKDGERSEYRPNSKVTIGSDKKIHLLIYSNPSKIPLEMFDESVVAAYTDDLIKADLVEKVDDK